MQISMISLKTAVGNSFLAQAVVPRNFFEQKDFRVKPVMFGGVMATPKTLE